MDAVNKTLYIPLYGKSYVSKKNIILRDIKAEEIWEKEQFPLKRRSRSRWLAYFMAMRAKIFDAWTRSCAFAQDDCIILHIGCGLDSRYLRINDDTHIWYDIDLPEVIAERRKYYEESANYTMLAGNASRPEWIQTLPNAKNAVVLLEGISMYLPLSDIQELFYRLTQKYENVRILMDVYTRLGARASRYKNPINELGVTRVYGIDDPDSVIKENCIAFVQEWEMAPASLADELQGLERWFFKTMFSGSAAKSMYRLFEYKTKSAAEIGSTSNQAIPARSL